jgi:phosphoribosylanthranilate isomerase
MRTRVKICGLTHPDDIRATLDAGADALGFVFAEGSKRQLSLAQAAALTQSLPPFVARVGLFVNADAATVERTAEACGLDTLQFHGDETPEFCAQFRSFARVIKALRVRDADSTFKEVARYDVDAILLDAFVPGQAGGTGAKFDWNIAREAVVRGFRIILAGGLDPSNAAQAIESVRPFALDVSSGVESSPGRKDPAKVLRFIHEASGLPQDANR